ncbi:hypothetical protein H6F46_03925 [Limnothrix sp. FACHB-1083]|nr:hypothetical protein [Limnothrix sp. FACHB-1083]
MSVLSVLIVGVVAVPVTVVRWICAGFVPSFRWVFAGFPLRFCSVIAVFVLLS